MPLITLLFQCQIIRTGIWITTRSTQYNCPATYFVRPRVCANVLASLAAAIRYTGNCQRWRSQHRRKTFSGLLFRRAPILAVSKGSRLPPASDQTKKNRGERETEESSKERLQQQPALAIAAALSTRITMRTILTARGCCKRSIGGKCVWTGRNRRALPI